MNLIAAAIYWVIVVIWITIFFTVATFYFTNQRIFGTTRLLLTVLALDALRNIIENIYFGLYFGSKFKIFNPVFARILGEPHLLILPKIGNICAGCIVLGLLLLRWLPAAINERAESQRQAHYLHELATTDGMTGLKNRRHFITIAEAEWERCRRYKRALCLLMLDIDHFKSINDVHGHNTGDQIIIMVAGLCSRQKRRSDTAGRLGGEEFAILLPETKTEDAFCFAERLRELISGESLQLATGSISTTVSMGVSSATEAASLAELLKQADAALYEAKRGGRDHVRVFSQPSPSGSAVGQASAKAE